jgi:hypothetical protein
MGKIEFKFWQIIFCMEDRAYIMVYWDGNFFFLFFAIVPENSSPKQYEIQEFAKNYRISAVKINKMFVC